MNSFHELANRCEKALLNCQLPCGGWSYGKSRQWATEPTALALLALRLRPGANCNKGATFLGSCQRPEGSWPAFEGDEEGSWATALAVIALARLGGNWSRVQRGAAWLLNVRGQESHWLAKWRYRLFDRQVRFDPDKYGWPWTEGAASWVVPTSYSLIALRLAFGCCLSPAVKERIDNGTAMLFDRGCPSGGWNAGNGIAFDVPSGTPHRCHFSCSAGSASVSRRSFCKEKPRLAPKRVSIPRYPPTGCLGPWWLWLRTNVTPTLQRGS